MAKGLLGGMTDYNHQSFSDILYDLQEEKTNYFIQRFNSAKY